MIHTKAQIVIKYNIYILLMEHNAKNICRPVISGEEQSLNLNKWLNLEIPYFFKALKSDFTI